MSEIKSAIELAMERTRNMTLSAAEKEKIRKEEDASRAAALVNRFLHVDMNCKDLDKELAKVDPSDRKRMEGLILEHLGRAISLEGDHDLIFEGISALHGDEEVLSKIRDLRERYGKERLREFNRVKEELRGKFRERQISGSAVEPRVEGSPEWKETLARFKPAYETRLAALVGKL